MDARRVRRAIVALCLATLGIISAVLFVAGADKNSQINELRSDGVAIKMTVTRCIGLLGGSGSNAAGYACRGTYTFRGRRYDEAIPGNVNLAPHSRVQVVIAPSDPGLVSTVDAVREGRPSWRVFIAPAVLALLAAGAAGWLLLRRRRGSSGRRAEPAPMGTEPR